MKLCTLHGPQALAEKLPCHLIQNKVITCQRNPQCQNQRFQNHRFNSFKTVVLPRQTSALRQQHRQRHGTISTRASLQEAIHILTETPARDVAAVIGSILGARMLVVSCELLEEWGVVDQNLSRKLVHTLAGPLLLAFWPLFSSAPYARYLAAIAPSLNGIRLTLIGNGIIKDQRAVKAISRSGDPAELLRGPLYYVIVLLAVTLIYWRDSAVGLVVTSLMCGGDGLADIIGRRLGRSNPLPWNPNKSWAGSLAMFLGGFGTAMALLYFYRYLGYLQLDMPLTTAAVGAIAFVAAVIESLPINQTLDDNLSVPGVAAFLGIMLLQMGVELM